MNLKKTAIALAVASVAAAPIVASADGSVYASVRIGLESRDQSGVDDITVRNWGSRMGIKGETDLGNGLTAWGKYEFGVNTEANTNTQTATLADNTLSPADADANPDTVTVTDRDQTISRRHAVVGLKGDFGNVFLGQTYHTWYNHIVGPSDNPWWGSGYAQVAYRGRTDNGLSYAGDFGPVSVGVTAVMQASGTATNNPQGGNTSTGGAAAQNNSNENFDELELAASFDAGPVRLGVGIISESGRDATAAANSPEAEDIIGFAASGSFGGVGIAGSFQTQDFDDPSVAGNDSNLTRESVVVSVTFSNFYVHVESLDVDDPRTVSAANPRNASPTSVTLGYTHSVGPRTTMWFEYQGVDADDRPAAGTPSADLDVIRAALKYDIL